MTEEFKLGYYIEADALQTEEGIKEYTEMAKWCNLHKYVIKQETIDVGYYSESPQSYVDVYVIAEPDKPAEPTKIEQLEQEMAECKQWFRLEGGHDDMCSKCYALHLDFQQEYPDLFAEGVEKRKRINEIEREIALYS